jgi:hypothetical protein
VRRHLINKQRRSLRCGALPNAFVILIRVDFHIDLPFASECIDCHMNPRIRCGIVGAIPSEECQPDVIYFSDPKRYRRRSHEFATEKFEALAVRGLHMANAPEHRDDEKNEKQRAFFDQGWFIHKAKWQAAKST